MDPTERQYLEPHHQESENLNGMQSQHPKNNIKNPRKKPIVKITEQPASKALRFRYECEGRSAGSIPGVNSTPENKTYPTIEIEGYKGRAVVVVSCITKDQPYRPHPHNLVGKEGCKKGVCTLEINPETMRAVFSNLGIQCVKKKDIDAALKAREEIRVDPFKTGFSHRFQPSNIDLNSVRLCFQVFMESDQKGRFTQPLAPVVSEPIFDKKAMSDLVICRLCSCSATVLGNTQIILLCEKVAKDDISVRFYEEINSKMIWEAFGEFQHTDVHKQTAIAFKTPRYRNIDITEPVKVFIQLKRPSDGITSEALPFEYVPLDTGRQRFLDLRRNLKRKPDLDIFREIICTERKEKARNEESNEIIDLDASTLDILPDPILLLTQHQTLLTSTNDKINKEADSERGSHQVDFIANEKVHEIEKEQRQQIPQDRNYSLQGDDELVNSGQQYQNDRHNQVLLIDTSDKITEWMNLNNRLEANNPYFNEYIEISSPETTVNYQVNVHDSSDKTLNDLLKEFVELDGIYSDSFVPRSTLLNELNGIDSNAPATQGNLVDGGQTSIQIEDSFDDAATYSSLQIAFKHPISLPLCDIMPLTPPSSNVEVIFDNDHYNPIEVCVNSASATYSPLEPLTFVQKPDILSQSERQLKTPPRTESAQANSPHRHVTGAIEEKVPPLPPKRLRKQENNVENRFIEPNTDCTLGHDSRQQTPIIIMKSPDHTAPNKRLPQKPCSVSIVPQEKKSGFFSKLFSRRKRKSGFIEREYKSVELESSSAFTSCEPNINQCNLNDGNHISMRSLKSLQTMSFVNSLEKLEKKVCKQVRRSASSVSGKRPTNLSTHIIHIPLKGESLSSLSQNKEHSHAGNLTLNNILNRKTVSALQLANIPISDGNLELLAIADRQSLRNLCQGQFNVQLDPKVDLTEAEHFALYTSVPQDDDNSTYYASVDSGEILMPEEVAKRLVAANGLNSFL